MKNIKHVVLSSLFAALVFVAQGGAIGGVIGPQCGWCFYQPKVPTSLLK